MVNNLAKVSRVCTYSVEDIDREFQISAKTSIYRKSASAPLKILLERQLLRGSVLNFGKGRYDIDSTTIREQVGHCTDYDYTFHKVDLIGQHFDSVYAGYVVNTLPPQSRMVVWREIANATKKEGGRAYIAARSDADRAIKGQPYADGVRTSIGTFQIGFKSGQLEREALRVFKFAREIPAKSGFRIVECSHTPFD
ncbi:TPA: hypothetical protein GRR76_20145 [Vibrio parahaemolyticus]|nr:hypothetical protein [Vibrio parahaemolyticus]HAS6469787.1 hypothetical protein [Vibrio parahaemolyticus]